MPLTPTPTDPEQPHTEPEPDSGIASSLPVQVDPDAPLSFVPHSDSGAVEGTPVRIRAGRFGVVEEHELIRLLDTIEDERARGRFRESVYISLFVWLAIAWVVLYGPRYLWHAPKLVLPSDVLREREVTQLTAPVLPHTAAPAPKVSPKLDNHTLEHLREQARRAPAPPPPTAKPRVETAPAPSPIAPVPSNTTPNVPPPNAPRPAPARTPPVVAEAPAPQPATRPNFNTGDTSAGDAIQNAIRDSARNHGGGAAAGTGGGSSSPLNTGVDILSDTQGVNFDPYLRRILHDIYYTWLPLIPEEARPPLNKSGITEIRFTILPDGHIGAMHLDGSTHDDALNRAAWGSITGVGQFPPLPSQFHGPNLELRIHYLVNKKTE